jgi:hypothetical protein
MIILAKPLLSDFGTDLMSLNKKDAKSSLKNTTEGFSSRDAETPF